MAKLTTGMELWWVPSNQYRKPETVTVEKVGRKWASLSNRQRIDVTTLETDAGGYASPGRAWPSQAEYEAFAALRAAWADLRNDIYKMRVPPAGVTVEAINALRKSVGLEVSPPAGRSALTKEKQDG